MGWGWGVWVRVRVIVLVLEFVSSWLVLPFAQSPQ